MGRRIAILSSSEEMVEFGKNIGSQILPGTILALTGDLGAGKTTFVQGLALGLDIHDPIQSPTFVYLNSYAGKYPLFHFDLYRLKGQDDFLALGFDEFFMSNSICVIEWPERIATLLPKETKHLSFEYIEQGRKVVIS